MVITCIRCLNLCINQKEKHKRVNYLMTLGLCNKITHGIKYFLLFHKNLKCSVVFFLFALKPGNVLICPCHAYRFQRWKLLYFHCFGLDWRSILGCHSKGQIWSFVVRTRWYQVLNGSWEFCRTQLNSHDSSSQLCEPLTLLFCCMLRTTMLILHEIFLSRKQITESKYVRCTLERFSCDLFFFV